MYRYLFTVVLMAVFCGPAFSNELQDLRALLKAGETVTLKASGNQPSCDLALEYDDVAKAVTITRLATFQGLPDQSCEKDADEKFDYENCNANVSRCYKEFSWIENGMEVVQTNTLIVRRDTASIKMVARILNCDYRRYRDCAENNRTFHFESMNKSLLD